MAGQEAGSGGAGNRKWWSREPEAEGRKPELVGQEAGSGRAGSWKWWGRKPEVAGQEAASGGAGNWKWWGRKLEVVGQVGRVGICLASSRAFQKDIEPSEPQCLKPREEF